MRFLGGYLSTTPFEKTRYRALYEGGFSGGRQKGGVGRSYAQFPHY